MILEAIKDTIAKAMEEASKEIEKQKNSTRTWILAILIPPLWRKNGIS
ncbi:MAG: hypothetical protein IPL23_08150 [Saprospiraceae bacterium]|nr:hypothetical protein [Saprospiraceae bacterium]